MGSTCSERSAPRTSLLVPRNSELLSHATSEVPAPDDASYYGSDAALVATYEGRRGEDLGRLLGGAGFRLNLWGSLWNRLPVSSPVRACWRGRDVHEQEIPVIYACAKIALHWVGWEPGSANRLDRSRRQMAELHPHPPAMSHSR